MAHRHRVAVVITSALVSLLAALVPARASAQAQDEPPPRRQGSGEVGFVGTTGNSDTSTFAAGGEYIVRPTGWMIRNHARFVRSAVDDAITAESIQYGFRAEHELNARLSTFGDLDLFRDEGAGTEFRTTLAGGIAFKIFADARQTFTVEGGLGYLDENRVTGEDIASAIYTAGTAYKLELSESSELTDDFLATGTFDQADDWRLDNTIALTAKLTTIFSLKLSSQVRFSNFPPPGFKKTDTTTTVALVASYKRQ